VRLILAFFVLATIPTTALACLTGEPGLYWMIKNSTLIVRGQVLRDNDDNRGIGPLEQKHLSDVRVERVYKGTAPSVIRVGWKETVYCPGARLDKNAYGLFFLRPGGSEFLLVSEEYGKLTVSRWQDDSRSPDPSVAIERDFKRAIQNEGGGQRIEDVSLLGSLRRPMSTAELHALLPTKDEVLESTVHLALLKLHDYSKLEAAGKLVETVESRSFILPRQMSASLRSNIGLEIMRIEDPRQLRVLQRFTQSSSSWLRQNAAYAVRHLHDFSSVRYLIRLLDDPSDETRIQAIRGLAELLKPGVEGHGWIPGTPQNGRNLTEEEVIARWKAWWKAEGEPKYGKRTPPR
jgi:hypothetical protein